MFTAPYPTFSCPSGDGRNFVLQDYLYFTRKDGTKLRCIKGADTDGASTPQIIWNKYPPFGLWWLAAILHDCAYRCNIEKLIGDKWVRVAIAKDECDELLLEAMESSGVSIIDRNVIYEAVKNFGVGAFSNDLAQPITK